MVLGEATKKAKSRRPTTRGQRQTHVRIIHDTASQHADEIVLEFGSALVRVGLAGESKPRHIVPHALFDTERCSDGDGDYYRTTEPPDWERILLPFLADLYTKCLLLKPRSRRVILVTGGAYQYPAAFRAALESVLLHGLSVPSVLFVDQFRTIIPYALGHTQKMGIVLDIGRLEGRIGCVFEEACLLQTLNMVPCGFEALARMVMDYCKGNMQLEVESIHDGLAIIQSCIQNTSSTDVIVCHLPHADKHVQIKTRVLEDCIQEMYLDLSNPNSLVHAFFKSLLACPLDLRKDVVRNVVLVGGATLAIPNLERRFLACIRNLFQERTVERGDGEKRSYEVRSPEHAKFQPLAAVVMDAPLSITYPLPFSPTVIAWVGGSIMGSLDLSKEKWIHRADFKG